MKLELPWVTRFDSKIGQPDQNGCWPWIGTKSGTGYGVFWLNGRYELAHRLVVLLHLGKDPGELFVCHRCDNRICVNPKHMFIGDQQMNISDMVVKGRHANTVKTHCKRGHPFNEENTYRRKDRPGRRTCKMCANAHSIASYYRLKDQKEVA